MHRDHSLRVYYRGSSYAIQDSPSEIQVYLVKQMSKIIAKDKDAKKNFAAN